MSATLETERRWVMPIDFLPTNISDLPFSAIWQGYLSPEGSVPVSRLRLKTVNQVSKGYLTLKHPTDTLGVDVELESPLSKEAVLALKPFTLGSLDKVRYELQHEDHLWEIDVFSGVLSKWAIVEVELKGLDEAVVLPLWLAKYGVEITQLKGLRNVNFAYTPHECLAAFEKVYCK